MNDVTITPTDNAPRTLVQGDVTVLDAEGNRYDLSDTIVSLPTPL